MKDLALRRRRYLLLLSCLPLAGCTSLWTKDDRARTEKSGALAMLNPLADKKPKMPLRVGEAARAVGMTVAQIQAIALLTQLHGTGGIPEPGRQRDELINEIRTHVSSDVNQLVDSPDTAMAVIQAVVPPGIREGDLVDVKVQPSQRTVASSFRDGWLMPTRLREMRLLEGQVRSSDVLGTAVGPVVTRWDIEGGDDPQKKLEGVVVGGGKMMRGRPLSLTLRPRPDTTLEERVAIASAVAESINERFSYFDGARRKGVANAKSDETIELATHNFYVHSIHRYMAVIDRIPVLGAGPTRELRIAEQETRLQDPATAADAALTLEALGRDDSKQVLQKALGNSEVRIRYLAAEALAYMEDPIAVPVLQEVARNHPEMRFNALRALQVHPHHTATDALAALLHEPSNETRYGALRELRERSDASGHLAIRKLRGGVEMCLIPTTAPPLVAVSTSKRPLIALFGAPIAIRPSSGRVIGEGMTVRGDEQGRLRVSLFRANRDDRVVVVPPDLESLLQGLTELGINYGGLVAAIRQLKEAGDFDARLAFDPLPRNEATESAMSALAGDGASGDKVTAKANEPAADEYAWWDARGWF